MKLHYATVTFSETANDNFICTKSGFTETQKAYPWSDPKEDNSSDWLDRLAYTNSNDSDDTQSKSVERTL